MMLKKLLAMLSKRNKDADSLVPPEEESNVKILSEKAKENLQALKPKQETATLIVDRNKWAILCIVLSVILLITVIGWYKANERFANHVRVAFVKLDSSGSTSVSFYDENSRPTYFLNTINSLLTNYVERRYSKIPYSISADYGYAINFMSPQMQNNFLHTYKAAEVAAKFSTCRECAQVQVKVRTIAHEESDSTLLNGKPGTIYRSTVFVRSTELNPDGSVISKVNEIIMLIWTLRDLNSLSGKLDEIQANPIGIEILSDSLKSDPTPVNN
jgi:hypothetical protein